MPYATLDHDQPATGQSRFRKALVQEVRSRDGAILVQFDGEYPHPGVEAELALSAGAAPEPGDRVLVAWSPQECFVIGVLARNGHPATASLPAAARDIRLSDGTSVRVGGSGAGERVQFISPDEQLVMEYEPALGRLRLNAPSGNLELASAMGDIVLHAAGAVRLAGSALTVTAKRARLNVEQSTWVGDRLVARVGAVHLVARRVERVVDEIHEQANRVYRTVRDTLQLRAGRVRAVVDGTYYMKARRTFMKADDDFKVKSDKIHLG